MILMGGTPPQSLHSTIIQLGMVINVASEMALNQEILPLAMLRKHLWDKAAEIQTSEEWNNPTPVILLLLTKYIYVDSVDVHLHRCVQTHTDAVVYAPGWPDTSQLWSGSLSRTASQNTGGNQVHRTGLPLPGSESA